MNTTRLSSQTRYRTLLLVAAALALGVVAWEHLIHTFVFSYADAPLDHLTHALRDALLAFPLALLAVTGGLWLARRLGMTQYTWLDLLGRVAILSILFVLLLSLSSGAHGFIDASLAGGEVGSSLSPGESATYGQEPGDRYEPLGQILHGTRDALLGQLVALPLLALAILMLVYGARPGSGWWAWVSGPRRASVLASLGLGALGVVLLVLALNGAGEPATALANGSDACDSGPSRTYKVSAIHVKMTLNRFGDHDPEAYMYALDERIAAIRANENAPLPDRVSPGLLQDPIQPLVLRANLGECLEIKFTNRLKDGDASLHVHGLPYGVDSAGSAVGFNADSYIAEGDTATYRYPIPTDATVEGSYYFHDHGASRQRVAHGLFGAVVVEPADSTYLDPETGDPLDGNNWEAIIKDPNGIDFREFVIIYHEIGDESFTGIKTFPRDPATGLPDNNADPIDVPQVDDIAGVYRPASKALNYRSEPFRSRLGLSNPDNPQENLAHNDFQGYGTYAFGDPATPMPRSYLGEPTKTRLMHGGSEVFHVHHLHGGADRWRRNPRSEAQQFAANPPLQKLPEQNAHSSQLDSQTIGPSTAFNLEHECGAGGCQQAAGDFLYHCHIGHHYLSGMWSFWRVFDTQQPDLAVMPYDPDNPAAASGSVPNASSPPPTGVNSVELIGRTLQDGRTVVAPGAVEDPATQVAVDELVEEQLPPQGARLDQFDATVWDWQRVDSEEGPLYLGEPETSQVWANYDPSNPPTPFNHLAPGPEARPEILFNPRNGRYTWPLLRPHLGKRPPFAPNGHSGAPWLGEDGTAARPDGLCPTSEVVPNPGGIRQTRYYPITAVTLPIQITDLEVDPEGQIYVLNEDKDAVLAGAKPAQPLAIRSNVGDCVAIIQTSELKDNAANGFHSKVNMHTHFVQFDPQASDGVITGASFEQSVRPYTTEGRNLTGVAVPGDTVIQVNHTNRLREGIWLGVGLGEGMCGGLPCTEIRRIQSIDGNTITLDEPLANAHGAGEAVGVEFVQYRWYSDVDSGTVFWHDHVNFKNWDHGLFGSHIIEPCGATYHDPVTGQEVRSGGIVDVHVGPNANCAAAGLPTSAGVDVSPNPQNGRSFREFMLFLHNRCQAGEEGGCGQGSINLRSEPFEDRFFIGALAADALKDSDAIVVPQVVALPDPSFLVGRLISIGSGGGENRVVAAVSGATITLDEALDEDHFAGEVVQDEDASLLFSSVRHDDPFTPIPRAYVGDPFVIRYLGVVERVGGLRVTGHRFRVERFAGDGARHDAKSIGISEREDLALEGGAGGPGGFPGDYLYYSTMAREFDGGAWGLIRVHDTSQPGLRPLPDRPAPPVGAGFPQQTFTGASPAEALDPGNPCPAGAEVRSYDVRITRARIIFRDSTGRSGGDIEDSGGVAYVLNNGDNDRPELEEPLILRANHGDCLEVSLTNGLDEEQGGRASFSLGKLQFDPQGSYGAAVGFNPGSTVAPGDTRLYRFYADRELGTSILLNLADPEQIARGAYGAVIVEPPGSTYRHPDDGSDGSTGVYADIITPTGSFREYVALFSDEDPEIGQNVMPYPTEVDGLSGINYSAEPFEERDAEDDPARVFDSDLHRDPRTLLEAHVGDPLRLRVAQPWGEQVHVFSVEGHRWPLEPNMAGSSQIYSKSLAPGEAFEAHIIGGAGGEIGTIGDYLYLDHRQPFLEAGLWGIMRVEEPGDGDLLPLP